MVESGSDYYERSKEFDVDRQGRLRKNGEVANSPLFENSEELQRAMQDPEGAEDLKLLMAFLDNHSEPEHLLRRFRRLRDYIKVLQEENNRLKGKGRLKRRDEEKGSGNKGTGRDDLNSLMDEFFK